MSGTEQFVFGLIVTLIGMGIVFAVLIFLVYLLKGIRIFANRDSSPKEDKNVENVVEEIVEVEQTEEDNSELIAVIGAAIAQMMSSQSSLVVRSIIRLNDETPAWAKAGRQEQMQNRL